jgi:hypothetical protein
MVIDSIEFRFFPHLSGVRKAAALAVAGFLLSGCSTTLAEFEPYREVVCFAGVKVALSDAVAAAERQGGRVIDAHYHQTHELGCLTDKPGYYDVTMLREGRVVSGTVDVRTNAVEMRAPSSSGRNLGKIFVDDPDSQARAALQIPLRMPEAIALAEREGGKAMKAYVETRDGKPGYLIKLVMSGGKVHPAWIDGGALALSSGALPQ